MLRFTREKREVAINPAMGCSWYGAKATEYTFNICVRSKKVLLAPPRDEAAWGCRPWVRDTQEV